MIKGSPVPRPIHNRGPCACGFGSPTGFICPVFFDGSCPETKGKIEDRANGVVSGLGCGWMVAGNAKAAS
jgi:hypothetical protein